MKIGYFSDTASLYMVFSQREPFETRESAYITNLMILRLPQIAAA